MDIIIVLLVICLLIVALSKLLAYKLRLIAVILYYSDRGFGIPSDKIIQEYELKAAKILLGIKEY